MEPDHLSQGAQHFGIDAGEKGRLRPTIAPKLARAIVAAVFASIASFALLQAIVGGASLGKSVLAGVLLTVLVGLQLLYLGKPGVSLRSPSAWAVVVVQACIVLLPQPYFGDLWLSTLVFLTGGVLLVVRPPVLAWAIVVAAFAFGVNTLTTPVGYKVYWVFAGFSIALYVYGLTRLAGLVTQVHEARGELGRAVVARERTKFAQDLNDLLGLSLATIGPKGASARQLIGDDPARARAELGEILAVARHALADVRLIASGYRNTSLREESRSVEALLAASNVDVKMEVNHTELPVAIRTMIVAVLRAGVADVLDHPEVARCGVVLKQVDTMVVLDIIDDGVGEGRTDRRSDEGFDVLVARAAALGGELTAGRRADGRYHTHLKIPVVDPRAREANADDTEQVPRFAALLSTGVLNFVIAGFAVSASLFRWNVLTADAKVLLVNVAGMAVIVALQLVFVSNPARRIGPPTNYVILVCQLAALYVPWLLLGNQLVAVPGIVAGSIPLLLRSPVAGWIGFVLVVASSPVIRADILTAGLDVYFNVANTASIGLVVYGLTWMARSVWDLRVARRALAQAALVDERVRFAQDLHDLLGLSLSAITLKSELAQRLIEVDPSRARTELMEIVAIARLALADVRLVANGYRDLSLNEESRSAESALAAADVDVQMDLHYGELPVEVRTVLATVLREGVTNVLRHSKGARCEISVRQHEDVVVLEIVNDGVSKSDSGPGSGAGIRNLSDRVARVGGQLTAGMDEDGTFRLRALVPA